MGFSFLFFTGSNQLLMLENLEIKIYAYTSADTRNSFPQLGRLKALQCISEQNPLVEVCVDVAEGGPDEPHLGSLHVGLLCSSSASPSASDGGARGEGEREGGSDDVTLQAGGLPCTLGTTLETHFIPVTSVI